MPAKYAKDCKCCVCGKPAVAFWPIIDQDIPASPYCRRCLKKAKMEMMEDLCGDDRKLRNSVKEPLRKTK